MRRWTRAANVSSALMAVTLPSLHWERVDDLVGGLNQVYERTS